MKYITLYLVTCTLLLIGCAKKQVETTGDRENAVWEQTKGDDIATQKQMATFINMVAKDSIMPVLFTIEEYRPKIESRPDDHPQEIRIRPDQPKEDIRLHMKDTLGQTIRWIYPLKESEMFKDNSITIPSGKYRNGGNSVVQLKKPLHDTLQNSMIGQDHIMLSAGKVGKVLISIINYLHFDDGALTASQTEIAVYDEGGEQIAHVIRKGIVNASITHNKKYLCLIKKGGSFTEEAESMPYGAEIYDVVNKKTIWEKRSDTTSISVGPWYRHLNTITIVFRNNRDKNYKYYFTELDQGAVLKYKGSIDNPSGDLSMAKNGRLYYNIRQGDRLIRQYLSYEEDFKRIDSLP